ncbi:putative membrane protein [Synechococcus sp. NOUM97013]|nr:putative membrane protein [Synechococcus sp. NOUM97013]
MIQAWSLQSTRHLLILASVVQILAFLNVFLEFIESWLAG